MFTKFGFSRLESKILEKEEAEVVEFREIKTKNEDKTYVMLKYPNGDFEEYVNVDYHGIEVM